MPSWLVSIFGGLWGYVAAFGIGAALSIGGTYEIVHNANAVEIGNLKLAAQTQQTQSVTASLNQLQGFIARMHAADSGYQDVLAAIDQKFAALDKEFKNAIAKPLPADCKPDLARLRQLTAAVAATKQAASPAK